MDGTVDSYSKGELRQMARRLLDSWESVVVTGGGSKSAKFLVGLRVNPDDFDFLGLDEALVEILRLAEKELQREPSDPEPATEHAPGRS